MREAGELPARNTSRTVTMVANSASIRVAIVLLLTCCWSLPRDALAFQHTSLLRDHVDLSTPHDTIPKSVPGFDAPADFASDDDQVDALPSSGFSAAGTTVSLLTTVDDRQPNGGYTGDALVLPQSWQQSAAEPATAGAVVIDLNGGREPYLAESLYADRVPASLIPKDAAHNTMDDAPLHPALPALDGLAVPPDDQKGEGPLSDAAPHASELTATDGAAGNELQQQSFGHTGQLDNNSSADTSRAPPDVSDAGEVLAGCPVQLHLLLFAPESAAAAMPSLQGALAQLTAEQTGIHGSDLRVLMHPIADRRALPNSSYNSSSLEGLAQLTVQVRHLWQNQTFHYPATALLMPPCSAPRMRSVQT
jgi:hypothetical protein